MGLIYSQASSDFGMFLSAQDAAQLKFMNAFRHSFLISALGLISSILAVATKVVVITQAAAFCIIWASLQIIAVPTTLVALARLQNRFNQKRAEFFQEKEWRNEK